MTTIYCPATLFDEEAIAWAAELQAQFEQQDGRWTWRYLRPTEQSFATKGDAARDFIGSHQGRRAMEDLRNRQLMDEMEADLELSGELAEIQEHHVSFALFRQLRTSQSSDMLCAISNAERART